MHHYSQHSSEGSNPTTTQLNSAYNQTYLQQQSQHNNSIGAATSSQSQERSSIEPATLYNPLDKQLMYEQANYMRPIGKENHFEEVSN